MSGFVEFDDEYGWHEDRTPPPIHYRVEGDDRKWLAYKTTENDRLLLTLVVDKDDGMRQDTCSMYLDDPRLSVWRDEPAEKRPEIVKVALIRRPRDSRDKPTLMAEWMVPVGQSLAIDPSYPGIGEFVILENGVHVATLTIRPKKIGSYVEVHNLVTDPVVPLAWGNPNP